MEITLTLKDLGFILIIVCVVVLLIYCISFVKNLIVTIKHTNKILQDAEVISAIAADRAKDVDKIVSNVSGTVENLSDVIKGNQSIVAALSSIVNAVMSLKNLIKR